MVLISTFGHESWVLAKKCYFNCKRERWDFFEKSSLCDNSQESVQLKHS